MTDIIKLLPDNVANQIAAGEVVQRPSSAVKELLENAIDSGASDIKLIVKNSGKTLVQVIDNGCGMSPADALKCFERHATSKISKAEDLFSIKTMGFRGEALASIASVAQVELKTKRENDELAISVYIEGSEIKSQEFSHGQKGTSIAVKNLFYNIPARRNFLKSESAEFKHILEEFLRVAIAHCNISFSLSHNSNTVYRLESSNLKIRLDSIFGSKNKDRFFPINEETDIVTINGFVAKPEYSKKRRGEQYFFVNNRYIKSSYLNHAVSKAFEALIPSDAFPSYFIFLEVDPNTIDINIHPTKTEIKFEDEKSIYAFLFSTIKHSLGQYNIMPSLDFTQDRDLDDDIARGSTFIKEPSIDVDPDFNPFLSDSKPKFSNSWSSSQKNKSIGSWEGLYNTSQPEDEPIDYSRDFDQFQSEDQQTSFRESHVDQSYSTPKLFQLHGKYIISQVKSGVLILDQRRAHKRILFDSFVDDFKSKSFLSQQLLFHISLDLDKMQIYSLESMMEDLKNIGYTFGEFYDNQVQITGIPSNFDEKEALDLVEKILDSSDLGEEDIYERKINTLARLYSNAKALKYGTKLDSEQMESIINRLFACSNYNYCPAGKLISRIVSLEELDQSFN